MLSRRDYITTMTGQLKKVAGLARHTQRARYRQALVEGPQAVREAVQWAPELIRDLYVTQAALDADPHLEKLADERVRYVHLVPDTVMEKLSPNTQGWLAVINQADQIPVADFFATKPRLVVLCLESADPGNLGTVIRSADAVGADAVITAKTSVDIFNPKVVRSSVGSVFHLPILSGYSASEIVQAAREAGMMILCADARGDHHLYQPQIVHAQVASGNDPGVGSVQASAPAEVNCDMADACGYDLRRPTVWLVGNEAHGVSQEQRSWADYVVSIPMWGHTESLNAAVATSLCLYASACAQRGYSTN
ncbi:TrmH family RNA methyltransferase [Trueperella sp. LYQ141]|uniref:TrmH family RNA methyltransferase n=1 Tax=Trueperella sp. LYQ141 TaxID=3391058 RepID=UPI0039833AA7